MSHDLLGTFLQGGREGLARKLGQDDPRRRRWKPPANENERRKSNRGLLRHVWNKVCALVLVDLWLAYLYLADEHHYRDFGTD